MVTNILNRKYIIVNKVIKHKSRIKFAALIIYKQTNKA